MLHFIDSQAYMHNICCLLINSKCQKLQMRCLFKHEPIIWQSVAMHCKGSIT